MQVKTQMLQAISVGVIFVYASTLCAAEQPSLSLLDFDETFDTTTVDTSDCTIERTAEGALRVETGHAKPWPGVTLRAPDDRWDLSDYQYVQVEIVNAGDSEVTVNCRVDNPGADGVKNCVTGHTRIDAGKKATIDVRIFPSRWRIGQPIELIGMRGAPAHEGKIDTSNVTQMVVFINHPKEDHAFEILRVRATGQVETIEVKNFLPFIDKFGQFMHKDWPGKTHFEQELTGAEASERRDLAAHPGPTHRGEYGGWSIGPERRATGSFRVEKYLGKWWFIDPDGYLFWSHGIDCVHPSTVTPISDRVDYFAELPASNSPFAKFYGTGTWAPHGYYKDHSPYKTYDFARSNLLRKYGEDWETVFAEITHERLRSWGLNTIGNWSGRDIYLMEKTPYVCTVHSNSRKLEGSEGYWGKFFDVFDPDFERSLRRAFEDEKSSTALDPWCIGYFVHNELSWGDELSLAIATLKSPADQPAKQQFAADLQAKYTSISSLNSAWGSTYRDWDDLLESRQAPDKKKSRDDLSAFYRKTAETYFRKVRAAMTAVAPLKLYLGCRFAWANDNAIHAAGQYCDVISFNKYTYSVEDFRLPSDIDRPVIIGEFHFGALDRGMFHTGLRKTANQEDRAEKYRQYVRGALRNPIIIGTHWFQYKDQATTGRGDGENYQIGFIDVCDKPYPEIIRAARDVGYNLYEYRLKGE